MLSPLTLPLFVSCRCHRLPYLFFWIIAFDCSDLALGTRIFLPYDYILGGLEKAIFLGFRIH
jgi:hypothetical protein